MAHPHPPSKPHPAPPTITTTASPAAPPPDLQLQQLRGEAGDDDKDDEDFHKDENNEETLLSDHGAGSRRPSTASLSRFRSCPQLASVMNASQDSPGCDMAPMTDADGNILHTVPAVSHKNNSNTLQVERPRFEMTSTPTPPSTPGSRRKDIMVSSTQSHSNGASPSSTPKLSRRSRMDQNLIPRTVSADSQGVDSAMSSSGRALTTDNLMKLDELCLKDSLSKRRSFFDDTDDDGTSDADDASSMHLCGRHSHQQYLHHSDHRPDLLTHRSQQQQLLYPDNEDDSVEKCSRWLQGLKLSKSDKIKSRSHIQLPAI